MVSSFSAFQLDLTGHVFHVLEMKVKRIKEGVMVVDAEKRFSAPLHRLLSLLIFSMLLVFNSFDDLGCGARKLVEEEGNSIF